MNVNAISSMPVDQTVQAALPQPEAATKPGGAELFDYMVQNKGLDAGNIDSMAHRLGNPANLGDRILSGLDGFNDRATALDKVSDKLVSGLGQQPGVLPGPAAAHPNPAAGGDRLGESMQLVGQMFDFAIETQLVSKGANQVSSSANTLLKGQ